MPVVPEPLSPRAAKMSLTMPLKIRPAPSAASHPRMTLTQIVPVRMLAFASLSPHLLS